MGIWPEPYRGAISLTFDDGMASQLDTAIPGLDTHGFHGTFYLNPRDGVRQNGTIPWAEIMQPWIPHQANGHEIGNHTLSHPCSLNLNQEWQKGKNLLFWDLEMIEKDILEAQSRIDHLFPSQGRNSFAYPCYESSVGRGLKRASYTPIVAKHFTSARAKGELRGDLANDPTYCDLHHLSSWPVERYSGAFMVGLIEQAVHLGRWGIFTIHGIQEGHLPVGNTDFSELLNHLDHHREEIWVGTVSEIARYVQNIQNPKH